MTGTVLALDLATTAGWAIGRPGERPRSGVIQLQGQARAARFAALLEWLDDMATVEGGLTKVAVEAALSDHNFRSIEAGRLALGFVAHLELWCWDEGVPLEEVHVQTARKAVLGRGVFPKGEAKENVLTWAREQGFEPATDDQADALVTWHYATGWRRQPALSVVRAA